MPTTDSEAQDREAMARLVAGQDTALDDLMARHAPGVFRLLYRWLRHEEDAQDLAQETFVRVFRARASYHPRQKFSTWLFTIASNLARNQLRWRARHPNVSLEAPSEGGDRALGDSLPVRTPDPHQSAEAAERVAAVRAAVGALPDDLREVLLLCEWEELAVAEAATVLGTSAKAVESRLYRARQRLRADLRRWLPG